MIEAAQAGYLQIIGVICITIGTCGLAWALLDTYLYNRKQRNTETIEGNVGLFGLRVKQNQNRSDDDE